MPNKILLTRRPLLLGAAALAAPLAAPATVRAQSWPAGPIRLVVPFAPGGTTDLVGRLLADQLSQRLNTPFIVENRAGGTATVGSQMVADAAPDGQTLLMSNIASHGIGPSIYRNLRYDPVASFSHIAMVITNPSAWVVNPNSEIRNLEDIVRLARETPGGLNMASSGVGSSNHLLIVQFARMMNIPYTHVPFRGAGPARQAVIQGTVPMMSDSLPSSATDLRGGQTRGIAMSSAERHSQFPDIPTFRDQGVDLISTTWFSLSGPAGMDPAIVERLNTETRAIVNAPEMAARFADLGGDPGTMTPQELSEFIAAEVATFRPLVEAAGITPEG